MTIIGSNVYKNIQSNSKITYPEEKVLNDLIIYNGDLDNKKLLSLKDYLDTNEDRIKTAVVFGKMIGKADENISRELYVLNNIHDKIGIITDQILLEDIGSRISKLYSLHKEVIYEQNNRRFI